MTANQAAASEPRGGIDSPPKQPPWRVRLVMTLIAWLIAFILVLTLLSVFNEELASLPLAARALVLSGVLVTVMSTLVMPALNAAIGRWVGRPGRT